MRTSGDVETSYCKTYPQSIKAVAQARREVVQFARDCGFSGQALADIESCVGEGLANAVEHGYRNDDGFEVSVRHRGRELSVEIKDHGQGFDHRTIGSHGRPPAEGLRGFGTFIMRELMDDVRYSEYGTRLRLLKRLP